VGNEITTTWRDPVSGKLSETVEFKPTSTIEQQQLAEDLANQREANAGLAQAKLDAANEATRALAERNSLLDDEKRGRTKAEYELQLARLEIAKADAERRAGKNPADERFQTQTAKNLADMDADLQLGSLEAAGGFARALKQPPQFTPQQQAVITAARAAARTPRPAPMVVFPPVAGSTVQRLPAPAPAAGNTVPMVRYNSVPSSVTGQSPAANPLPNYIPPTPQAIEALRENPALKDEFEAFYGPQYPAAAYLP
jgi:hypothetical protein